MERRNEPVLVTTLLQHTVAVNVIALVLCSKRLIVMFVTVLSMEV
jgi:hypothetical protein